MLGGRVSTRWAMALRTGTPRPVIIGKRLKIPVTEIEQLLVEGAPSEVRG
jgi:hypothetical protein